MVEEKDEEKLPPEVKKDLINEGWTPPEDAPEILSGGEGQEKQNPEVSSEAIEAGNETVETPTLSSKEAKNLAESLLEEGYATTVVEDKTGLSAPVVRGLKGALAKKTKKLEEEAKAQKLKEEKKEEAKGGTKKLEEKEKPLVPYAEMGGPDEFLRSFLEGYEFKDRFIDLLCRRVVLREELPHPNDLAADLLSMEGSGVKSARNANAIAEDYGYALRNYLGEMGEQNKPHTIGYDVHPTESYSHHGGIPRHEDYERPSIRRGIPVREPQRDSGEEERRPARYDMDQPMTMKDLLLWQREQELQRLKEDDGGRRRRDEAPDWMQDRMEKLEERIRQRDEDRMQRLEDELKNARNTPPPTGVSPDDVTGIVESIFDARSKKLTAEDVQRIVRDQTSEFRVGLTKDDLEYLKAKDQYRLEERKLDDKTKSRDEFAKIARGATSQIGQILARTLTETGATTGTPTKGIADQTGTVMQVACPGCGAAITSPITENMIQCSQCGRSYTVERPPHETLPPSLPVAPPKERAPMEASFSVEPPPTEPTSPIPEKPVEKPEEPVHVKPEEPEIEEHGEPISAERMEEIMEIERKELKKEKPIEKKPMPKITSNVCPILGCGKKLKSKTGVRLHIEEKHPEYVGIRKK